MQLEFAQNQGIAVLSLKGQINAFSAYKLVQDVRAALVKHDGFKAWALDLSRMEMRDSTGLSAFMDCLQSQSQTLLKISRVHFIFDFYPTLSAALGSKRQ